MENYKLVYLANERPYYNCIKLNQHQCYLMISGLESETTLDKICGFQIWKNKKKKEELVVMLLDNGSELDEYALSFCKIVCQKYVNLQGLRIS